MSAWEILLWPDVEEWIMHIGEADYLRVAAAIDLLAYEGPKLGRPLVDRVAGSRHHNMKELRPRSAQSGALRILFAFDPRRRAILLVAGDKAGQWSQWYERNVAVADDRFDTWLAGMSHQDESGEG